MVLDGEHQQKRDEEREDPERFGESEADEEGSGLRSSSRRVAQGARQVVAGNVADTASGSAGADGSQTGADELTELSDIAFQDFLLTMELR